MAYEPMEGVPSTLGLTTLACFDLRCWILLDADRAVLTFTSLPLLSRR